MIDPENIPPIADNELLARFILNSNEKRDDGNVNHKLFMPYKWAELSVNRHREASIDETWAIGFDIASQRSKVLYGLANIRASSCYHATLKVAPDPILPNNPNHANIMGYPPSKEDQMAVAKVLAASLKASGNLHLKQRRGHTSRRVARVARLPAPNESDESVNEIAFVRPR